LIATNYDLAARPNLLHAFYNFASSISYASHGAVQQMTLGNSLTEQTCFNNRLQPLAIRLGAASSANCANTNSSPDTATNEVDTARYSLGPRMLRLLVNTLKTHRVGICMPTFGTIPSDTLIQTATQKNHGVRRDGNATMQSPPLWGWIAALEVS